MLINCCSKNEYGAETYYTDHEWVCGYCGATEEDNGEE